MSWSGFLQAEPEMQIVVQVIYWGRAQEEPESKGGKQDGAGHWSLDWQCQHHLLEIHVLRWQGSWAAVCGLTSLPGDSDW